MTLSRVITTSPSTALLLTGLLLTALVALSAGCAVMSGAVTVPAGSRVEVHLYDSRAGTLLALANETHPDWVDVYSQRRADANLKLAPEDMLGALLGELDQAGFAHLAQPGPPPDPAGLRGYLLVRRDDEQRTVAVPGSTLDRDLLAAFARMKLLVDRYYGSIGGLQLIENDRGHRFFERGR